MYERLFIDYLFSFSLHKRLNTFHSLTMQRFTLLILFCFISVSVLAQTPEQDSIKRIVKGDVVITSSRIQETLTDMPMAVSAVPAEQFKDSRGYELRDALWSVPGVLAQSRGGHTDLRITMRGYGARGAGDRSNAGNMRGVRVLIDGIPETEPDGRTVLDNVDLFNVSKLEVLRSNASALYGSPGGGVISLYTNSGFPHSYIETRNNFGSFGYMKNALLAGARTGSTTLFTSYSKTEFDGYRVHSNSNAENFYLNLSSQLDENTALRLTAAAAFTTFRFAGALTMEKFELDPRAADSTYIARDERRNDRVGRLGFTIDRSLGKEHTLSGTFYFQPRFITRSERGTYREFTRLNVGSNGQYTWNTKFGETGSSLIVGFDQSFQDGAILFYALNPDASQSTTLTENQTEPASNNGFYLQEELTFGDLSVMIGGRYDLAVYKSNSLLDSMPEQTKDFTHFTPKVSIGYSYSDNGTVYALYGGGVENPAFNEINPPSKADIEANGGTYDPNARFNLLLEPVISASYEVGTKGAFSFADGSFGLRYDVAAFMIKINNDLVPWNGGRYYFTAAETTRNGVELGLGLYSDFGLSLQGAFTMLDSKYDKYTSTFGTFDGNETAGIPSSFANLRARYDVSIIDEVKAFAEVGMESVGEYYADDRNDKLADGTPDPNTISLVPSYMLFNGTVGLSAEIENLRVNVFAALNNITDEKYVASAFINGSNNKYFEPGLASNYTVGIGLKYAFAND